MIVSKFINDYEGKNFSNFELFLAFKQLILNIPNNDRFVYLFEATLNEEHHVEFNIKYNSQEDQLDIIMNDISRSKSFAKQMSEFKYKTLFLSKVTHEFKNPLICISELVNEKMDDLNFIEHKGVISTFNQIKSMSDYLCILIKDFNYYTEREFDYKEFQFDIHDVSLDEILTFCNSIAETLLKKANKLKNITYKCTRDIFLSEHIKTDETRIKQILINLISNAIKYTFNGEINFIISKEEEYGKPYIKFKVADTGIGLPDEFQESLFNNKFEDFTIRQDGTLGFGLSICNSLVRMLGSTLKFESNINRGSCFWFSIPTVGSSELNITEVENSTLIAPYNLIKDTDLRCIIYSRSPVSKSNSLTDIIISEEKSVLLTESFSKDEFKRRNLEKKLSQRSLFRKTSSKFNELNNSLLEHPSFQDHNYINVIIADDDILPRQSSLRILKKVAKDLNLQLNLIEVSDGCEIISVIYKSMIKGVKIHLILSDENMCLINGTTCAKILKDIGSSKNITNIPFYINSSYNKEVFYDKNVLNVIDEIFDKPISSENAKKIINKILNK